MPSQIAGRRQIAFQHPRAADQPLHRAFDLVADDARVVKFLAAEHDAQERLEIVPVLAENGGQRVVQFRRRRLAGEKIPELGRDEPRRLRLGDDLRHHIVAVEIAGAGPERS